jgi:hypothetical protein
MSTPKDCLYIIGDRFGDLSQNFNAITISEIRKKLIDKEKLPNFAMHRRFVLGQGVAETEYRELYDCVARDGLHEIVLEPAIAPRKASKLQTHKHYERNILIGEPELVDSVNYRARLLIDDRCDEMADHLTGAHVQGMVIIEAARQMMLAVCEEFIARRDKRGQLRYTTRSVRVDYYGFLLPIDAEINLACGKLRIGPGGDFALSADIAFVQNDIVRAQVATSVSAISRTFIEARERAFAPPLGSFPT